MTMFLGASTEQTSTLTGLSVDQLRRWRVSGFFAPEQFSDRGPYRYVYSFRDVVGLRTIATLQQHGIAYRDLQKVGAWFQTLPATDWGNARLWVDGGQVYFEDPRTGNRHAGENPPQSVFAISMKEIVRRVEQEAELLHVRPVASIGTVSRHRNIMSNQPVVAGTRIPTAAIRRFRDAGYSVADIQSEYPQLTVSDIDAALDYEHEVKATG